MIIGLDVLAGEVCVTDGWLKLLVLKVGVRGGELLGRQFPCEEPFFEFFLGERCRIKNNINVDILPYYTYTSVYNCFLLIW